MSTVKDLRKVIINFNVAFNREPAYHLAFPDAPKTLCGKEIFWASQDQPSEIENRILCGHCKKSKKARIRKAKHLKDKDYDYLKK